MDHPWERSLAYLSNYSFMGWAGYTAPSSYYKLGIEEFDTKYWSGLSIE